MNLSFTTKEKETLYEFLKSADVKAKKMMFRNNIVVITQRNRSATTYALRFDFPNGMKTNCGGTIEQVCELYGI